MIKNPGFIDRLVNKEIIYMKKDRFPGDINFDVESNVKPQILFAELLRLAKPKHIPFLEVSLAWGFDVRELPNTAYLLRAIYFWDPNSPVINALPRINTTRKTKLQEAYEAEKIRLAIKEIQITGKVSGPKHNFDFYSIKDHIQELSDIFFAYHVAKFELTGLKRGIRQALLNSEKNPTVHAILAEAKVPELVSNVEWGLNTPELQAPLQSVQRTVDQFNIESLPPSSNTNQKTYRKRVQPN